MTPSHASRPLKKLPPNVWLASVDVHTHHIRWRRPGASVLQLSSCFVVVGEKETMDVDVTRAWHSSHNPSRNHIMNLACQLSWYVRVLYHSCIDHSQRYFASSLAHPSQAVQANLFASSRLSPWLTLKPFGPRKWSQMQCTKVWKCKSQNKMKDGSPIVFQNGVCGNLP